MAKKLGKRGRVPRAVSISAELDKRMRQAKSVNWSEVARLAFERKLGELAGVKKEKSMADVIDRLRASQQKKASQMYKDGFRAGREWAEDYAEVGQLERLDSLQSDAGNDWELRFCEAYTGAFCVAERLAMSLADDDDAGRDEAKQFWKRAVIDELLETAYTQEEFVRGFAEGALDLWRTVKTKL